MTDSPQKQLDGFLAKFSPDVEAQARACLETMRGRLPFAVQMVYDNYQALVIGFGPSEKASHAIFSIAVFPKWVTLCFLQGAAIPDLDNLLKGEGNVARSLRLKSPADLDRAEVIEMMERARKFAEVDFDPKLKGYMVIKSISAKQKPRR